MAGQELVFESWDVLVHKKGGIYRVLSADATDSETQEPVVVYQNTEDRKVWVRPLGMFTTDRFRHINDAGDWLT